LLKKVVVKSVGASLLAMAVEKPTKMRGDGLIASYFHRSLDGAVF